MAADDALFLSISGAAFTAALGPAVAGRADHQAFVAQRAFGDIPTSCH